MNDDWTISQFTPYPGWRFIADEQGAIHHVPTVELIKKVGELHPGIWEALAKESGGE